MLWLLAKICRFFERRSERRADRFFAREFRVNRRQR